MGLDKPYVVRWVKWVADVFLRGDFGTSCILRVRVNDLLGTKFWISLGICLASLMLAYIIAIPLGIYSATTNRVGLNNVLRFISYLGLAMPNFLLALVLLYTANVVFGTSIGGLMDPIYLDQPWTWGKAVSVLEHLWIPVVVIGTSGTAGMIRRLRANLLDELNKQYVVTGRAKGLPPFRLLVKYPLRMSLNPFIAEIATIRPIVPIARPPSSGPIQT